MVDSVVSMETPASLALQPGVYIVLDGKREQFKAPFINLAKIEDLCI